jgi:hypothetical protein
MRVVLCGVLAAATILSGCLGSDATELASGLNSPASLIVVGDKLFWIDDDALGSGLDGNSSIQSMPITGGKPTIVLSQHYLDGNLASDGTLLYFSYSDPIATATTSVIASCGLDGSNVKTLSAGSVYLHFNENTYHTTWMSIVNGTLYFQGEPPTTTNPLLTNIYSMSATGGTPGIISALPAGTPAPVSESTTFYFADSTGVYFQWEEVQTDNTQSSFNLSSIGLGGGSPNTYFTVTLGQVASTLTNPMPPAAGVAQANGTLYFLTSIDNSSDSVSLKSVSATGGSASTVATFAKQNGTFLVADANGMYMNNTVNSNNPGIFKVSTSGQQTSIYTDQKAFSTSVGNDRVLALDSKNVYWVAGGFNAGQGSIHAKAR